MGQSAFTGLVYGETRAFDKSVHDLATNPGETVDKVQDDESGKNTHRFPHAFRGSSTRH